MTVVTEVLDHMLGPLSDSLSAEEVRRLSMLPRNLALDARMDELAEKANEGTLTVDERREYELYIETSDFVAIMLARARARLRAVS